MAAKVAIGDIVLFGVSSMSPGGFASVWGLVGGIANSELTFPPPSTVRAVPAIVVEVIKPEDGDQAVRLVVFGASNASSGPQLAEFSSALAIGRWTYRPSSAAG